MKVDADPGRGGGGMAFINQLQLLGNKEVDITPGGSMRWRPIVGDFHSRV